MFTRKVIDGALPGCLPRLHSKLVEAIKVAVGGALKGASLTLSQLARAMESNTAMRHRIKRMDRLLGNPVLQCARVDIYRNVAKQWLSGLDNVLVVIDWSDATTDQCWHLLRASVAVEGRSVTLYEEIHPQSKYGNPAVHRKFLDTLATILPAGCTPTVLTDAGFRSTWFVLVTKHGWQWIGRIRGKDMVSIADGPWQRSTVVFKQATMQVQDFENALYVRSHPTACRLVLTQRQAKGRNRRTRMGKHSRSRASLKAARSAREPWLLACSKGTAPLPPETIISQYSKRMRIELSFRDLKNEHLGMGFTTSRTRSGKRLEILLLIGHLASWLMRLIGEAAKQSKMQPYFQSVPNLKHNEISVLTLARRVLDAGAQWLAQLRPKDEEMVLRRQAREAYYGA